MKNFERYGWSVLASLLVSVAHADGINKHSATLSVLGDENDNRQWLGKVALPFSDHVWAQASLGRTELATAPTGNSTTVGAALGIGYQMFDATIDFAQRRGDAGFEQQDWAAALGWHGARASIGADLLFRSADGESQRTTASGSVFAPPVTTTLRESVDARGFGLHGAFALTPQANVFAGAMRYRYDFSIESTATGTSTALSPLFGTTDAFSGAWRDQAYIDRSYRLGASYRFQAVAVNAQYLQDRTADTDEIVSTVQLQAEFLLTPHWMVSPLIGYSSGGNAGPAGYGGLSLSIMW